MPFSSNRHRLSSRDRMSSIHRRNIFILKILLIILMLILFLSFILATVKSGSVSMEPTLNKGANTIYHPLQNARRVERGDVLLIEVPYYNGESLGVDILNKIIGFLTFQKLQVSFYPREPWVNRYMIKRVVALPGDTIKMEDWVLYVRREGDKYYLSEFESTQRDYDIKIDPLGLELDKDDILGGTMEETVLNEGEYFVLGDNRRYSNDSYYWGVLAQEKIKGKLLFVYWPFSQFGPIP